MLLVLLSFGGSGPGHARAWQSLGDVPGGVRDDQPVHLILEARIDVANSLESLPMELQRVSSRSD